MHCRMVTSLFLVLLVTGIVVSQTRTVETRTSVDSLKRGDTTITKSVIISKSEDITPINSIIIVNPLKFFVLYNISYIQRISPGAAVGGGIQTPTISGFSGFGFNVELRLYPSAKAPRGFYVAPIISVNFFNQNIIGNSELISPMSIGVLLGWQWFPGDEFAMGLGLGIDYYSNLRSGDVLQHYNGAAPNLRFDIGYGW